MNPLESRKRLLIAESELNRAQLFEDLASLGEDVSTISERARSFRSIASSAAVLVAGLAFFRSNKPALGAEKTSWARIILRGAGLVSTIWLAFRSQSHALKERHVRDE